MRAITVGFACNNACVFCAQGDARLARPSVAGGRDRAPAIEAVVPRRGGRLRRRRAHPLHRRLCLPGSAQPTPAGPAASSCRPTAAASPIAPSPERFAKPRPGSRSMLCPPGLHRGDARLAHGDAPAASRRPCKRACAQRAGRAHPCGRHHRGHALQLPPPSWRSCASRMRGLRRGDPLRARRALRPRPASRTRPCASPADGRPLPPAGDGRGGPPGPPGVQVGEGAVQRAPWRPAEAASRGRRSDLSRPR